MMMNMRFRGNSTERSSGPRKRKKNGSLMNTKQKLKNRMPKSLIHRKPYIERPRCEIRFNPAWNNA
jgi:hypothetical protein